MRRLIILAFLTLVPLTFLVAGQSGKITGRVQDAATGDPLIGANILLSDTPIGSASDLEGYYVILNVPPGTYSMRVTMIGYADIILQDVVVYMDLTTQQLFSMQPRALGLDEVVVTSKQPIVIPDVAASESRIRRETIDRLPVGNLTSVIGLEAGIEGLVIRGGAAYQTVVLVDGISMVDKRNNLSVTNISLSSIQEVKVKRGGFSAEYGNVRSGIINISTREGNSRKYSGAATIRYSPAVSNHFGPSIYSADSYYGRPFLDPVVAYTGTDNGVWDRYEQRQYVRFGGYDAISSALLEDDDPDNDLTPTALMRLYTWEHRRQGDIGIPDYTVDFGVGGPIPGIGPALGNLRFFLSYRSEQDAFIFPLSRDSFNDNWAQIKLTSDLSAATKLNVTVMSGKLQSVSPAAWTTPPDGTFLQSDWGVANRVGGNRATSVLYQPGYFNPMDIDRTMFAVQISSAISDRTFYEIILQTMLNKYSAETTADRDTTFRQLIVPGYSVDEAPYGYYGYDSNSFIDGMGMGGWMGFAHDWSENRTTRLKADITSQITPVHQFKSGFEIVLDDFDMHSANLSPVRSTWQYELEWNRKPYHAAGYIRDLIEIRGFITELGIRLDYANSNGDWYVLDDYDDLYTNTYGEELEALANADKVGGQLYISPRLNVSHPITVDSKIFFNYGHSLQELQSDFRFKIDRRGDGSILRIGQPDLPHSRTIQYELGYERNLMNHMLLSVNAFYKDVTEQPSWTRYLSFDNSVDYSLAAANNYQDVRGLEVSVQRRTRGIINGFINYTYMVTTSGYFGLDNYFEDPAAQRDYLDTNPEQEKPLPTPFARANLDIRLPKKLGPWVAGIYPFGGWNVDLLGSWKAGSYFTYPTNLIGVENNVQWRDYLNFDLRVSKLFDVGNSSLELFADVRNVFNIKIFSTTGFSDSFDRDYYLESLHLSSEEGVQHGDDRPGDVRKSGSEFVPIETVGNPEYVYEPLDRVLYYSTTGEEFIDSNGNSSWDAGENFTDLNQNNSYDGGSSYWQYRDGAWQLAGDSYVKIVLDEKRYIDMPNLTAFTFLNPRRITLGLRINF